MRGHVPAFPIKPVRHLPLTRSQPSWFHRWHMSPPERGHPIRVEIPENAYQALLKGTAKGSKLTARLVAAEYGARKGKVFHTFTGSRGETWLLRAVALVHAKSIVPTKALKAT